jgi:hypothetical protein
VPTADIDELIVAERLVECFEADLWGGPTDFESFSGAFVAACAQSKVKPIRLDPATVEQIRHELQGLSQQWCEQPLGASLMLRWP